MKLTPEQLRQNAAAMIAFADGKPIECLRPNGEQWEYTNTISGIDGIPHRPKPEPKVRQWSKPEDVPDGVIYIRHRDGATEVVVEAHPDGVTTTGHCKFKWEFCREFSLDRKTWHPCTVTET